MPDLSSVVTAPIQGQDVILEVSDDNGTTWFRIACLMKQGNKNNRPMKQTSTQCGPIVGKGASLNRTVDFEGAVNTTLPATVGGIGYASGLKLKTWLNAGTALLVRQRMDADTEILNSSKGYISDYNEDDPVDDIVTFNGSFFMFGTWTFDI